MQQVVRQLEQVRRTGRALLIAQVVFRWLAVVLVVALACGLIDYLLRLPGWLRLGVGLAVVGVAGWWLVTRFSRAAGFAPDLSQVALRAERMTPRLAGVLASGVEFTTWRSTVGADGDLEEAALSRKRHGELADAARHDAESKLGGESLKRLIEPTPTLRVGVVACIAVLLTVGVVAAAPAESLTAARRWFAPLGDAQWPRRNDVTSLVAADVHPIDQPVPLAMRVDRGYRSGLRATASFTLTDAEGETIAQREVLLTDQTQPDSEDHRYESMLDLSSELSGIEGAADGATLTVRFAAGDAATEERTIRLVARPAVEFVTATIKPPAYAIELAPVQTVVLSEQTGRVAAASALQGSRVHLAIELNKPLPRSSSDLSAMLPGFAGIDGAQLTASEGEPTATLTFTLVETVESSIQLKDEHGLSNLSDRLYRFVAVEDKSPSAHLSQPPADESVLATAVLDIEGKARDDVGVEKVALVSAAHSAEDRKADKAPSFAVLASKAGRGQAAAVTHELDLSQLDPKLKAGDELLLAAVVRDVYELDGQRHPAVRSTLRRLLIVDEATLIGQLRSELSGVRQRAIELDGRQRDITKQADPSKSAGAQQRLTQAVQRQRSQVGALKSRAERNRLNDPQLNDMLRQAGQLLQEAQSASQTAAQRLDKARAAKSAKPQAAGDEQAAKQLQEEAKRDQETVNDKLTDLVALLDQGNDLVTLQLKLRQMGTQQGNLAGDTRKMLPRTVGRDADQLPAKDKAELDKLADRQDGLAEQAKNLIKQMQAAAEAARQGKSPRDKAAAQALREAAAIAQRQGLTQQMQQAAQQTKQNQLSQAGQQQNNAQNTIQQMMRELNDQQRKQQEVLKRTLAQLAEELQRLITQQEAQLNRLKLAQLLTGLDEPLVALRRTTMTVQETAKQSRETQPVAEFIGKAVDAQAAAVLALRANNKDDAMTGETDAVRHLQDALAKLREEQQKQQDEEDRQTRDKLRQEYEKLVAEQKAIRAESQKLAEVEKLTRRQRQELLKLSAREDALRAAAQKLGEHEEVVKTLVFRHLHGRIETEAAAAVDQLKKAQADALLLRREASVANDLQMMADALAEANRDQDEFAQRQQGGDQGGGQQGQQQRPPLIPPVAELKLLRNVQASIYKSTRSLHDIPAERMKPDTRKAEAAQLGQQQNDLAGLGTQLLEKLEQQRQQQEQPGQPRVVTPPDGDDATE